MADSPHSEPQETYSVEQVLYENVELRQPVSEERLVWLLDRLQRLEEELEAMRRLLQESYGWMNGVEPKPAEPFLAEVRAAVESSPASRPT